MRCRCSSETFSQASRKEVFIIRTGIVVIGAGPSGIAAAIQLRRQGLPPLVFEKNEVGGLLRNASLVENYPGFPEGIRGTDLVGLFRRQLAASGVEISREEVVGLDYEGGGFVVSTKERTIGAETAVIATGTRPRAIPGLDVPPGAGRRVFYEAYPLFEQRGRRMAIVGAGDAAFDYALSLSRHNEVVILARSEKERCIQSPLERCERERGISFLRGASVREIREAEDGLSLSYARQGGGGSGELETDFLVVAVGRDPCLDFLGGGLRERLDAALEEKRLFLVGDVANDIYRQTAICVGDGVRAAMEIARGRESPGK